ncbi:selenoprotein S-like [Mya arenaria]|uniref:selenoprotein S-like n=1 Tax=Mya arenaria TaxID=6604 RepID=UPI0022E45B44|nr:selenoprotein S-like [Mya arenaria]
MDAQNGAAGEGNVDHPDDLVNDNPLSGPFNLVLGYLQAYGWILVFGVIVCLYLKSRLTPALQRYKENLQETIERKKFDPEQASSREAAREAARQRMQEQLDAQAARHAEQMKEKEEEKRKQKIQDWEGHLEGRGYRSKVKPKEEKDVPKPLKPGQKSKPLRSPDFNPLAGDGASCAWRPGQRRGGGG